MSFQLLYNNEPIDVAAGSDAELQQTSPLFGLEQFIAEYSTPITIKYTDRNNRLLSNFFLELTAKAKTFIPVAIMESGSYSCSGTLVVETSGLNREFSSKSNVTGYLLVNVSDFFSTIKDKKLTELELGGIRSFDYTTNDPTDGSNGYWQHFRATWDGTYDYAFFPAHNPNLDGNSELGSMEWMNQVASGNLFTDVARVFPFIRLKYILQRIFTEHGWTVDFSGINDADWEKIFLYPTGALEVSAITWRFDGSIYSLVPTPVSSVNINIADFLDPNYTCSKFILQVSNRYGWAPVTNSGKKECRFVALKENANYNKKDWTKYAQPGATEDYKDDPKAYSFRNQFTGNDNFSSDESTEGFTHAAPVATKFDLPTPGGAYDNTIIFAELENQWYKVEYDSDSNTRNWEPFRDEIYDDEVEDSNSEVNTELTTMAEYWTLNETRSAIDYYILVPYCEQPRAENAGLRAIFFWGMMTEKQVDGSNGTYQYPYSSAVNFGPDSDDAVGAWANVFLYRNQTEYGIKKYWFEKWFNVTHRGSDVVRRFNLPLHELVRFSWDDKILDRNIEYLVKSINRPFPYKGYIEATLRRLVTNASLSTGVVPIYLRLDIEVQAHDQEYHYQSAGVHYDYTNGTVGGAYVRAFSDIDGTIPLSVTDLEVKVNEIVTVDGDIYINADSLHTMNGTEKDVNTTSPFRLLEYDYTDDYFMETTPRGHYIVVFTLLPNSGYTVI